MLLPHEGVGTVLADAMRRKAKVLDQVSWDLDSALSMARKARAGYRANPAMGDTPWDVAHYDDRVQVAEERARLALDVYG